MLETSILNQVRSVFQNLEAQYTFHITCHPRHGNAQELTELLKDVAGCSDKLSCEVTGTEAGILFTEKRERNRCQIPRDTERP